MSAVQEELSALPEFPLRPGAFWQFLAIPAIGPLLTGDDFSPSACASRGAKARSGILPILGPGALSNRPA